MQCETTYMFIRITRRIIEDEAGKGYVRSIGYELGVSFGTLPRCLQYVLMPSLPPSSLAQTARFYFPITSLA